jgi:micrococcal nuclease
MKKRKEIIMLAIAIILLVIINYSFLDQKLEDIFGNYEYARVIRVIDGDTLEIANKEDVRFLGINAPERGEAYYTDAKEFLNGLTFNKTVKLEFGRERYDQYNRILAYVFVDEMNVNIEAIRNGYANVYLLDDRRYERELNIAWDKCIAKEINICEKSKDRCAECIELKEFDFLNEKIILYNRCDFECSMNNWHIKDEGRKKFKFGNYSLESKSGVSIIIGEGRNNKTTLFWKGEEYVWTKRGDTLFLRDDEEKLVLWERY